MCIYNHILDLVGLLLTIWFHYINMNQGRQTGGVGGVSTPPEFWMGGLNTCQPPLILRRFILGGVGAP